MVKTQASHQEVKRVNKENLENQDNLEVTELQLLANITYQMKMVTGM